MLRRPAMSSLGSMMLRLEFRNLYTEYGCTLEIVVSLSYVDL